MTSPASDTTATAKITWYVYAGSARIRRTAQMRGTWGYDVTCTCGWDSRTGGATRGYIENEVWTHKRFDCPILNP